MKQLGIQVLFVDSNPDPHEFNSVQPNLQMMVETAIDYFVQTGYQKIGFIGGRSWDSTEGRNVLIFFQSLESFFVSISFTVICFLLNLP